MTNSSQYNKEYYKKNRDKLLQKHNNYNRTNKKDGVKKKVLTNEELETKNRLKKISIKNSANKLRIKRRNNALEKLGNVCRHCGFSDKRALQIDHVDGGGNKERKTTTSSSQFYANVIKSLELGENKYQLLCANCNWIKRFNNNETR